MADISAVALMDSPADRAGITITGLGVGTSVVTLWQIADGNRNPVQGFEGTTMNDAAYVTDHFCPLGRSVRYELEVLSGPLGASRATSNTVVVPSVVGWIQDALVPQNAVPVVGQRRNDGDIYLRAQALQALEYNADVSIFKIMGSKKPMALFGERMAEMGLDTSVGTRSAEQNARLKKLLRYTAQLVFRPLPEWGELELEGTLYLANAKARQTPVNVMMGGKVTWWDLVSDVVDAPAIKVLTSTFTYGDVDILMSTYQQKQDLMAGKTYLDDLKNPIGG
ncbi:hypothetical protein [Arthrobacter sp. SD76]|uniref:hypothetical protein n=1 Tax=Arthrobacter sp. SD76 TaxID=3415007 RepID=UPI003C74CA8E